MISYNIYKRQINYYETDKMGVVHHSNYIRFLEECRIHFLEQIGLNYRKMEDMGIIIPVLSVSFEYLSPVCFDDVICIVPHVDMLKGVKFEISYHVYSENMKVLHGTAKTSHCFLDNAFQPVRLKRDYSEIYDTLTEYVGVELFKH